MTHQTSAADVLLPIDLARTGLESLESYHQKPVGLTQTKVAFNREDLDLGASLVRGGSGRVDVASDAAETADLFLTVISQPWGLPGSRLLDGHPGRRPHQCRICQDTARYLFVNATDFIHGLTPVPLWIICAVNFGKRTQTTFAFNCPRIASSHLEAFTEESEQECTFTFG